MFDGWWNMAFDSPVERIADATGEDEATILRRGLRSYLQQELREVSLRMTELADRYDVDGPTDLQERIEDGTIDEHPAWEAAIEWENLETRATTLERLLDDF
jgi:hypothetical protein